MKKVNFFYIISIFLLFLNVGIVIYYYNLKTSFHVDELFSYGHANSSNGAYLVDGLNSGLRKKRIETYLTNRWFDGQIFHDYLTVQSEEQFNYKHIFKNLEVGVHPPLFYILLHTICSFNPNIFSKFLNSPHMFSEKCIGNMEKKQGIEYFISVRSRSLISL